MELQVHQAAAFAPPFSMRVAELPDAQLEAGLKRLAGVERKVLALLLIHLAEFDERRLYADRGQPSLFAYCIHVLGYSEQAAYKRIQAARAARKYPPLLQHLWDGQLHLAAIVVLAPHLRQDNLQSLLTAARGKSMHELELLAAGLAPKPDAADMLRALPATQAHNNVPTETLPTSSPVDSSRGGAPQAAAEVARSCGSPSPLEELEVLSNESLFRFSGGTVLRAKYLRARGLLLRGKSKSAIELVFEAALDRLLDKIDPDRRHGLRLARPKRPGASRKGSACDSVSKSPRPRSRAVSQVLRDAVWHRDGGRCTFVGPQENRCAATTYLEIDHIKPYALGGSSDDLANLRLLCRAHNQLLSRRFFGEQPRAHLTIRADS